MVLNAPLFIFLILVLVIPIVGIILFSFSSEHRLENYAEVLTSPVFVRVIATTVALGAIVAFTTIISAFIFSLWVLPLGAHAKALAIGLIVLPFFTSYLLRALSWIVPLASRGLPRLQSRYVPWSRTGAFPACVRDRWSG